MRRAPSNLLVSFAVIGGPAAWAAQFVVNLFFTYAQCDNTRLSVPIHGWQIGLSVAALGVGLAATAASLRLYRQTGTVDDIHNEVMRGFGGRPPTGRVHFLAIVGLTVNTLALAIIVMTGIGAPLLTVCQQS